MSKHILDHAEPKAEGKRVSEFARIDREQAPKAEKAAHNAQFRNSDNDAASEQRTREYLRIDRENPE